MKELARTNDVVRLSWLQALLSDAGIETFVLDNNTSVLDGSVVAIRRRLMVSDPDYDTACRLLADADHPSELADEELAMAQDSHQEALSDDCLLGGRVRLSQPAQGYRVAIDPVLLAAGVPAREGELVLDLGCGVGAASLCLLARVPGARVTGLELQPEVAALARLNAERNGRTACFSVLEGDILAPPPDMAPQTYDHVMLNPPYLVAGRTWSAEHASKATATQEGRAVLADWLDAALKMVKPRGRLVVIHRADRLSELLMHLHGRAGEARIFPFWPSAGRPAKRVLLAARKGLASPLALQAGIVLHGPDGDFTPEADAVLRDAEPLLLQGHL